MSPCFSQVRFIQSARISSVLVLFAVSSLPAQEAIDSLSHRPIVDSLIRPPFVDSLSRLLVVDSLTRPSHFPTSATAWTSFRLTRDDLLRLPGRTLEYTLPLLTGISDIDGQFHVRGSRSDAVWYGIDGFSATNPVTNKPAFTLIPHAVETVDIHTGVSGAAHGRALGGVLVSTMRTGGEMLEFSADVRTDDLAAPGKQFLNTNAYGYRDITVTASGPLPEGIRFFVAGRHQFQRNRRPMFLEPFRFDSLRVDENDPRFRRDFNGIPLPPDSQALLPGPVTFSRNAPPENRLEANTIQGNITAQLFDVRLQLLGSYTLEESRLFDWPAALRGYYRQDRIMTLKKRSSFFGAKASYDPLSFLSISLSAGLTGNSSVTVDPVFGEEWLLFTDSLANAERGYTEFRRRYAGPFAYSTIYGFYFDHPNTPNNTYDKTSERSVQFSIEAKATLSKSWSLTGGIHSESWTLRRYSVRSIQSLLEYLHGTDGMSPRSFSDDFERRVSILWGRSIFTYGYDVDGNITYGGFDAPRTPAFSSAFLQSSWRSEGYEILFGLRYERYDLKLATIDVSPGSDFYDFRNQWIYESKVFYTRPHQVFLPRFSFSVTPSKQSKVHFSSGTFAQYVPLQSVLVTSGELTRNSSGLDYLFSSLSEPLPGHLLKPERSTQFEAGYTVSSDDDAWHLALRAFQKTMTGMSQFDFEDTLTAQWLVWKNNGEAKAQGLEVNLLMKPDRRFSALLSYALSSVRGTATTPREPWAQLGLFPPRPFQETSSPLGYDQSHRGSLMLDVRFDRDDGPVLDGLRITPVFSFNSGRRYTREHPPTVLGASTVWLAAVRSLLDPRAAEPMESPNESSAPWYFNVDLRMEKIVLIEPVRVAIAVDVLNLFNRRHVINVYPTTGTTTDGWLTSSIGEMFAERPGFAEAYTAFNINNRWAYMRATGNDIYGLPRQIRLGLIVEM